LLSDPSQKLQSQPTNYTIVGVIAGNKTPLFYVPFIDIRSMGLTNYSQARVIVNSKDALDKVRRQIESEGFATQSVADTVSQINGVFTTARTILALLGFVALAVASLGMFNTLTVSLLERTREVGLMKTMGMKSEEVKELFLTESMIMAFLGGILGLFFGFIAGQILSIILSFFSVTRGVGFVEISYIPFSFVLLILGLSLLVGLVTGIYPARRATKISALNALRYE
jgi:putative ABC transport system permease protein